MSGGGYIGSWLHAFIRNHCKGKLRSASDRLSPVDNPVPGSPQDDPVAFLRKYSNYLAPRPGLFSADTWVIGSIWLRNVLLNQLILIPALGAVVLAAFLFYFVQSGRSPATSRTSRIFVMPLVAVVLLALTAAGRHLEPEWTSWPAIVGRRDRGARRCAAAAAETLVEGWAATTRRGPRGWCRSLMFVAAVVLGCGDTGARIEANIDLAFRSLGLLGSMFFVLFVLQTLGGFRRQDKHDAQGSGGPDFWTNRASVLDVGRRAPRCWWRCCTCSGRTMAAGTSGCA